MTNVDEEIRELAERAVHFADEQFHLQLDYSRQSVAALEQVLRVFARSVRLRWLLRLLGRRVTEEEIWKMAFVWGAYLGVTMQRTFGGAWSLKDVPGAGETPTLTVGRQQFFPVVQVHQRLTRGRAESIERYFEEIERELHE